MKISQIVLSCWWVYFAIWMQKRTDAFTLMGWNMLCSLNTDARAEPLSFLLSTATLCQDKVELSLHANYVILVKQKHFYKKYFSYKQERGLFAGWKAWIWEIRCNAWAPWLYLGPALVWHQLCSHCLNLWFPTRISFPSVLFQLRWTTANGHKQVRWEGRRREDMHTHGWWNSISMKEGAKDTTADLVEQITCWDLFRLRELVLASMPLLAPHVP